MEEAHRELREIEHVENELVLDTELRLGGEPISVNLNSVPLIDAEQKTIGSMRRLEVSPDENSATVEVTRSRTPAAPSGDALGTFIP